MIADLMNKLLGFNKESEEWDYYPRPSLAGPERCMRQMVYQGLKYPKDPISDRFFATMDDSKWHEELSLDVLRKSNYKVHSEQMKVSLPAPMTTGSIDGIITDMMGKDFLLEHKAINHFSFEALWKGTKQPLDYFTQIVLYLWGLEEVNPDINQAILLIKNKNTAQFLEYLLEYDKDKDVLRVLEMTNSIGEKQEPKTEIKDIVADAGVKFKAVESCINQRRLPKREYEIGDWQCAYCGWKTECWKNYEQEFEALETDAELDKDIETLCGYYLEVSMHEKEMEKEKEVRKLEIKEKLKEKRVRQGKAGIYLITNNLRKTERMDSDLIPEDIRKKATKIAFYEILNIRKIKEAKKE